MQTTKDYASKLWLQPSTEPRDPAVRLMNLMAFAAAAAFGMLAVICVMSLA